MNAMCTIARSSGVRVLLAAILLAMMMAVSRPVLADGATDDIPEELRQQLEEALQAKAKALMAEKDADGNSFKRGIFSKRFKKTADGVYEGSFTRQTAMESKLLSERFLVTLKKDVSGKWAVSDEKLQDSFDKVDRDVPGDEKFFKFQSLAFQREGFKITATNGSMVRNEWGGRMQITLAADDLAYQYVPPPAATGMYASVYKGYKKDYPKDLAFQPELASFYCTEAECEKLVTTSLAGSESITKEQASDLLREDYDKDKHELEKLRKERPFSGFNVRPYPGRVYWTAGVKKKGSDHSFWVSYDNFEPKEVSVSVSHLGASSTGFAPILMHYSEDTLAGGTSPYDLERRDDSDFSKFYELTNLSADIEMAVEDPELLRADATFTIKLRRDLDSIPYQIVRLRPIGSDAKETKNPRMTVNSVETEDGIALTVLPTSAFGGQVLLPKTAKAGSVVKLRMRFENRDSIYKLTSSFSYVDRGGWLPFVRFGDMIDTFDLTVRVPSQYKILGIGKEVYQKKVGNVTEARFTSPSPVVFPSIVFGDYVEAVSKVIATKADGTPIPVRVFLDETSLHDKIPLAVGGLGEARTETGDRFKYAEGFKMASLTEGSLPTIADEAASAINTYRELYGVDYPYAKLDLVNDPLGSFYGQAPSSLIYLGNLVFLPRGLTGVTLGGGGDLASFMYSVVAHETAHQWWGSLIANSNGGNYWFVESLAEYSAAIWLERQYGMKEYLKKVQEWRKTTLERDVTPSVQDASQLATPDAGAYQAAVYNKGPLAFHVLRSTFGDEKFFAFLKRLAMELQGKEIVTRDIQTVAEESFGGKMDWFFDQWIRGTGIPQFSFNYEVRKTEDGKYLVSGKIRQRVVAGVNKYLVEGVYYRGVVPITLVFGKGKESPAKVLVEGKETSFQFKVPEEPKDVVFNKYNEILAYDILVNRPF